MSHMPARLIALVRDLLRDPERERRERLIYEGAARMTLYPSRRRSVMATPKSRPRAVTAAVAETQRSRNSDEHR